MPTSPQDIKSQAIRYLDGQSTLDEFYKWFTAVAVALGHTEDSELRRLVDAGDSLFMRLSDKELSEDEFKARLLMNVVGVIANVKIVTADDYPSTTATLVHTSLSSNATEKKRTLQSA